MFNIMLDDYPTAWNGYQLNTDYRVGIQITQASADTELNKFDKIEVFALLLFKSKAPDAESVAKCVEWFLNGWCLDNMPKNEAKNVQLMDFDIDAGRIYSAFLSQYHIDLNVTDMHFWKFMYLLTNLEECAFTRVVEIRAKQITSKMSKEEREVIGKAKKVYNLTQATDEAEQEATDIFLKALNGDK